MEGLEVRRSTRGTLSAVANLLLAWVTALVLIGNQLVRAEPSVAWLLVGGLLLAWSAVIFSGLLRPVKLRVDDSGLTLVRLFGHHHFPWDALRTADFGGAGKFALFIAQIAGRDRFAALPKRGVEADALARAEAMVLVRRPDLGVPAAPGAEAVGAVRPDADAAPDAKPGPTAGQPISLSPPAEGTPRHEL